MSAPQPSPPPLPQTAPQPESRPAQGLLRICGVLGWPVGHSKSPALHNAVFAATGWPGAYTAWAVPPERLADFVHAARLLPLHGVSATIPHKEALCGLVDTLTPRAQAVGAVNTLYFEGDTLCGDNTDVAGFIAPLHGSTAQSALVLGAGGAARAVVAGLRELGVPRITATARNAAKADALATDFGVDTVDWEARGELRADMIINTTPCGMQGHAPISTQDATPYPTHAWARGQGLAYDLVYTPRETRFLREAKAAGWHTQDGLAMFVGQAMEQQRLWTGHMPDAAIQRAITQMLGDMLAG